VCCLLFIAGVGCDRRPQATVFCAASLTGVVEEVYPAESFRLHSGGSKALVSQFQGGARADLLLLADADLVKLLGEDQKFRTTVLASNRLVLARPRGQSQGAEALADPQTVLALADPKVAPLGRYSQQALSSTDIAARKVFLKDASAVLAALRLGHAELGVVYASDLKRWSELEEVAPIDASRHDPIRYAAALLEPAHPEALKLYQEMTSQSGRQALERAGFLPLTDPTGPFSTR
jgi:molybdate transport system substrate-binding protein